MDSLTLYISPSDWSTWSVIFLKSTSLYYHHSLDAHIKQLTSEGIGPVEKSAEFVTADMEAVL